MMSTEELLSAAWIAVCPSSFEGWGVVCLEANAHGIPVIASAVAFASPSLVR